MEENTSNPRNNIINNKNSGSPEEKYKTNCCSKISFYFSIVSLLGVITLFILYFFVNKCEMNDKVSKMQGKAVSVGFVNTDSILANYELVIIMRDSLEAKQTKAEAKYNAQESAFEASVLAYQKKVKANELSITEATITETQLTQQKEYLTQLYEELSTELTTAETEMYTASQDSIINFLKRYNKKYKFDYILGFAKGGGILLANDSLDITYDVLEGLNKEYQSE